MIHLESISIRQGNERDAGLFPFNLPIFQSLDTVTFSSPVTILVGDNGSGKSTLLEALACAVGSITVGSQSVTTDPTLSAVRSFSRYLRLSWKKRTRKGFFLRAEDFFGYARRMAEIKHELQNELRSVDLDYQERSTYAAELAKSPYIRELQDMQNRYGEGLDFYSHGESFLTLFQSRFVPGGLYILDEPEAPLSPLRQLGFLSLLKDMISQDSQFIIATHSPILMAFPGAVIYQLEENQLRQIAFRDIEQVQLMKDFLDHPDAFLRHL